jgi:hypothetical protein
MAFEKFFNLYTAETQHVFSWLIGSTEVDLADLIKQAHQQAAEAFDRESAEAGGEDDEEFDREEWIEQNYDAYLPEAIEEFVQDRLHDLEFGQDDFYADALTPYDNKNRDPVECLVGGLVSCAVCEVDFRVVADAIKLHLKHPAEADATKSTANN